MPKLQVFPRTKPLKVSILWISAPQCPQITNVILYWCHDILPQTQNMSSLVSRDCLLLLSFIWITFNTQCIKLTSQLYVPAVQCMVQEMFVLVKLKACTSTITERVQKTRLQTLSHAFGMRASYMQSRASRRFSDMMIVPSTASLRSVSVDRTAMSTFCIRSISWRKKMFKGWADPIFFRQSFTCPTSSEKFNMHLKPDEQPA